MPRGQNKALVVKIHFLDDDASRSEGTQGVQPVGPIEEQVSGRAVVSRCDERVPETAIGGDPLGEGP